MTLARCRKCKKTKVFPASRVTRDGWSKLHCANCSPRKVETFVRLPRQRGKRK